MATCSTPARVPPLPATQSVPARLPCRDYLGSEPDRQVSTPHQCSVVLRPVRDAVTALVVGMHLRSALRPGRLRSARAGEPRSSVRTRRHRPDPCTNAQWGHRERRIARAKRLVSRQAGAVVRREPLKLFGPTPRQLHRRPSHAGGLSVVCQSSSHPRLPLTRRSRVWTSLDFAAAPGNL